MDIKEKMEQIDYTLEVLRSLVFDLLHKPNGGGEWYQNQLSIDLIRDAIKDYEKLRDKPGPKLIKYKTELDKEKK